MFDALKAARRLQDVALATYQVEKVGYEPTPASFQHMMEAQQAIDELGEALWRLTRELQRTRDRWIEERPDVFIAYCQGPRAEVNLDSPGSG